MPKLTLSTAALDLQILVEKAARQKEKISYNASFLINYRPNITYYLSESNRRLLHMAGCIKNRNCEFTKKFILDLSYNSSKLEGNSMTLIRTKELFTRAMGPGGAASKNELMLLNHREAINFMLEHAKDIGINSYLISSIHGLLATGLLSNPRSCGSLRTIPVAIGSTPYRPLDIPCLIQDYYNEIINKASEIKDPFEQSFFLMVHLPYLQPFEDVNKRTSRLAANIPLLSNNLCPLTFADVDEEEYTMGFLGVYLLNETKILQEVYKWSYLRSCEVYSKLSEANGK